MAMQSYTKTYTAPVTRYNSNGSITLFTGELSKTVFTVGIAKSGNYVTPTPHSYTKSIVKRYYGTVMSYASGKLTGGLEGPHSHPYTYTSFFSKTYEYAAEAAALSEALDKLRGSIDLSVDLVQWRQMTKMVGLHRRLVSRIASSAKHLLPHVVKAERTEKALAALQRRPARRGRRAKRLARELNNSLNYIASKRLEWTYGWSPLMGSIYDTALIAINPKTPGWLVCEGKGRVVRKYLVEQNSLNANIPFKHRVMVSDRCRMKLYFNPAASVLDDIGKISSLNPVAILYEATPFSFVLDWAWDIGGWIRNLETAFLHRNDFVGGFMTRSKRVTVESLMQGIDYRNEARTTFDRYNLAGIAVWTQFDRTGMNSVPYQVRPQRQFTFGSGRTLNAIALAKTTLLRADKLLAGRR